MFVTAALDIIVATLAALSPAIPATPLEPAAPPPAPDQPLPDDPSLVRGALPNGVRYLIAPQPAAAGRVAIWMRVDVGALHEEAGQEGLAHLAEHAAFLGTRHYPRGSVTRRLEELGLTFGRDENATTSLRATTYKLSLPAAGPATLAEAVRIMADFAYRRDLAPADLAREKAVVLEEMRAANSYRARVDRAVFAAALAGTRMARRAPLGSARVIEGATPAALARFVARWYRPERTTLLVAGDVDPAAVADLIARELGPFRATTPAPRDPAPATTAVTAARATVVVDPEQPFAEVRLLRDRPAAPARTAADFRRELAARLAVRMLDERLRQVADGGGGLDDAYAELEPVADGLDDGAAVYGFAAPGAWRPLLRSLVAAVGEAQRAGFGATELGRARASLLADLRARATGAATRPVAAVVAAMSDALASGRALLSPAQRLALAERVAPDVGAAEVDAVFRDRFAASGRLTALILPARAGRPAPARAAVARVAREARRGDGAPRLPAATVDALLDEEPAPGAAVARDDDPTSAVTSVWLSNGVRVHLRRMTERREQVRVQVTLAGGELLETEATRGASEAAALAFDTPATERLAPAAIRSHLAGRDLSLSGCACDGDGITAELVASAGDLDKGMRLLHLVLTRGRIAPGVFQAWKDRALEWTRASASDPEVRAGDEVDAWLGGGDVRARPLDAAQIGRLRLPAAQAWLDRQLAAAPVEVAMVGDADVGDMLRLAEKYLGSLAARTPAGASELGALRQATASDGARPVPRGPALASLAVDSVAARAAIALAWRGPAGGGDGDGEGDGRGSSAGASAHRSRDALELAVASLAERLRLELRERRGLTYAVSVDVTEAGAPRGASALEITLSTDPRRAREAIRAARQVVARFAETGPASDELARATVQVRNHRDAEAHSPAAWADRLAALDSRQGGLDELTNPGGDLAGVTAGEVRAALALHAQADRTLTVVATPRSNLVLDARARPARRATR